MLYCWSQPVKFFADDWSISRGAKLAPVGAYGPMSWALFIDGSVLVDSVKLATVLLQRLRGDVLAVVWQLAKDSKMGAIFSL